MNTIYEDRINWILREISKGFKISPLNIAIFFIIISTIVLLYLYLSKRFDKQLRLKLTKIFNSKFQRSINKYKLSSRDIEIIKLLLNFVDSFTDRYLLLENEYVFQNAVKKLLEKEPQKSKDISSLRVKLGYRKHSFESIPHSTAELIIGTTVRLINKTGKKIAIGEITKITPDYFVLNIKNDKNLIKKDVKYTAQFQYYSGIFYFKTYCIGTKNFQVFFQHSENIRRIQRRNYFRKNIQLPIILHSINDDRSYYGYTTNLGGGGASIKGKPNYFNKGEIVNIYIDIPGNERITANAKIIDISKDKGILRISFIELKESDRDRIIKYIFEQ